MSLADANARNLAVGAVPEDDVVGTDPFAAGNRIGQERLKAAVLEEDIRDLGVAARHPGRDRPLALQRDAVTDADVLDVDVLPLVAPRRGEADADDRLVEAAVVDRDVADRSGADAEADPQAAAPDVAVLDADVFAGIGRGVVLATRADGKAVVAGFDDAVLHDDVLRAVDGEAVGVGDLAVGIYRHPADVEPVAATEVGGPAGSVL